MTFEQLTAEICEALNLTSDEAKSRVGRRLNSRYRRVTTTIGLETSRRAQVSKAATIGNSQLTFEGIEKIIAVIRKDSGRDVPIVQVLYDELLKMSIVTEPPSHFAVYRMGTNTVTIAMNCVPTTTFTLYADGHESIATLSGGQTPAFPESFHDILIFGVLADEYRKMEKIGLQKEAESDYERRLSDLRMWIAKSGYLDIIQGKNSSRLYPWLSSYRNW